MPLRTLATRTIALLLVATASGCGRSIDLDLGNDLVDRAAIGAVIRDTQEANNAGDADAWLALFDGDFRYLGPFLPTVSNRDSLYALAVSGFSEWQSEIFIEPADILVEGDWAFVTSEVRGFAVHRTRSDTVTVDTKQLVVYRRTGNGWRIARMAISPNA